MRMAGLGAGTAIRRHRLRPGGARTVPVEGSATDRHGGRGRDAWGDVTDLVGDLRARGVLVEVGIDAEFSSAEAELLVRILGGARFCAPTTHLVLSACRAEGECLVSVVIDRYDPSVLALWSSLRRDGIQLCTDYAGFVSLQVTLPARVQRPQAGPVPPRAVAATAAS